MRPLVSIIIPCYNAARYVGAALDSALTQTWAEREIIVVDDGSDEETQQVLSRYNRKGVTILRQENRGQCAAANRGWHNASGDLIKFFDADDVLAPDLVERQVARLRGRTDAIASAEWGRFYGDDLRTFKANRQSVWRDMDARDWLVESWSDARPMMQCAIWLIPRQVIEVAGGWDEELSLINDFEFFSRMLCHTKDVLFTPGPGLYYRSGIAGSLSGQKSRTAVESAFNSLLRGTGQLLKHRLDAAARRSCANMLQDFIYTYYPEHPDLRKLMVQRVAELGGSDLPPGGPPNFQRLRRVIGWRMARRLQRLARA